MGSRVHSSLLYDLILFSSCNILLFDMRLVLQVFAFVQKELWYKSDSALYGNLIFMLGKNKLIEQCEDLFSEFQKEKLQPDTRVYTEMIGAFLQANMVEKAMEKYKSMKELGTNPDKLTLTILIRNLEKVGLHDLASNVRKDCADFVEYPEKFLEKVDKNYVSIHQLYLKGKGKGNHIFMILLCSSI